MSIARLNHLRMVSRHICKFVDLIIAEFLKLGKGELKLAFVKENLNIIKIILFISFY